MASTVNLQLNFEGKSPIVGGGANRKRLTMLGLAQLLYAMAHGSRTKLGASYVQYQTGIVAASGTITPATAVSGNTVTIAGTALTAAQRRATGTVTPGTAGNVPVADDTITLNGVVFTAVDGAVVLGEATFDISGNTAAQCTSIAAQVNGYASPLLSGIVAARTTSTVVTFYAVTEGTAGNAITLGTNNNTRLAKSGAVLANGAASSNNTFDFAGTDATTAVSLKNAINASTTAAIQQVIATEASGVVTITAKAGGVAGNAITLTSSGSTLAVSGSGTLASGAADAAVRMTF